MGQDGPNLAAERPSRDPRELCVAFPSRRKALRTARKLDLRRHGAHVHFPPVDVTAGLHGVSSALAGPRGAATSQDYRAVADLVFVLASGLAEGCDDPLCEGHTHFSSGQESQLVVVIPNWRTVGDDPIAIVSSNGGLVLN